MERQPKLIDSAHRFLERRAELYETVLNSPEFKAQGVQLYPHDIVGANFPIIVELLQTSGLSEFLGEKDIRTVLDVGGANGDLAFVFAGADFETTLVDLSISYQKSPLVASLINVQLGANVRVVDLSVDGYFSYSDLIEHTVNSGQFEHHYESETFDLAVCFGLLYHLKNPFAFLDSIKKLCRFFILGTWLMSYFPDNLTKVRDVPLAYLLGSGELNSDPSIYWIFTDSSFRRLAERTGFSIMSSASAFGRADKISNPVDINYGERGFLLLRSE